MKCPHCFVALSTRTSRDTDADVCERCGGLFLQRGELNKIAGLSSGDLEYSTLDQETFRHEDVHSPIPCPSCDGGEMRKVEFIIYTNIILDYCSACGGFWLDGQELEKVNTEVRKLDETENDEPRMLWFARFIWGLPQ